MSETLHILYWTLASLALGQVAALVRSPEHPPAWFPYARAAGEIALGALAVSWIAGPSPLSQTLVATAVVAGRQWAPINRSLSCKGLLVAAGALSAITPLTIPFWALLWAIGFVVSGYKAAGQLVATAVLPLALGVSAGWPFALMALPVCLLVLQRLRADARRVLLGGEPKYHWRSEA